MSDILNDPLARSKVSNDLELITATLGNDTIISADDLRAHQEFLHSGLKQETYSDGRTKADVAVKLGISATLLSKNLRGLDVLDIGCGRGKFAADVAKDKSINITALDTNPDSLREIPGKPNITPIEGDGYDLIGSGLQPASFDAVFVTYATNFWASSEAEVEKSITEPLKVLRPGGSIYYTPIAQNLGLREATLQGMMDNELGINLKPAYAYSKVCGLFALKAYQLFTTLEEDGEYTTAFRASGKNSQFVKKKLPNGRLISPDSYSVVLTNTQ